ncbi:C6 finger domain-containing protein [Phlyctema vagabunda]|uniref:C6 finger domain-containing protein n=1 Tax=Phlyctema vagabunda TaxID=108571 RepID=A0ABR4P4P2_9HELO
MELSEEHPESPENRDEAAEENEDGEAKINKKKAKRTKTGCLTCRRRRIKCGEERPTCQNCTKSKRQCEGYNQRVVFKDPLSAYRGPPFSSTSITFASDSFTTISSRRQSYPQSTAPAPLAAIAPRPPGQFQQFVPTPENVPGSSVTQSLDDGRTSSHFAGSALQTHRDHVDQSHLPKLNDSSFVHNEAPHYDFDTLSRVGDGQGRPGAMVATNWMAQSQTSSSPIYGPRSGALGGLHSSHHTSPIDPAEQFPNATSEVAWSRQHGRQSVTSEQLSSDRSMSNQWTARFDTSDVTMGEDDTLSDDVLEDADDVDETRDITESDNLEKNDLGIVVALQARQDAQEVAIRSYTSFIDRANMLATYRPSARSSPLDDAMTARIFCHFIHVTGPSLSMFERHPANPSLIFQGRPVPKSQQHIWSYTFPILAIKSSALLHAILAIASLHIAKLQNGPIASSLKHCAIALRRVAKSVSLPSRRGQPATLAATMLLGFYECWCSDHQKWSNHLLGAKQLVKEIDFAGMTRYLKTLKAQQRQAEQAARYQAGLDAPDHGSFEERYSDRENDEVDENLVNMLMGKRLLYDELGRIIEDKPPEDQGRTYTDEELDIYENQRDLFWWYCKQDVYQSILGGGRLFMNYKYWSHCPPRAPLGRLTAIYGTFDHLVLLLGRMADFASKDLKRKKKVVAMNGGWRPPGAPMHQPQSQTGHMFQPTPQQNSPNSFSAGQPFPTPPPILPFAGMMPTTYEAKLPMGFTPSTDSSPQSSRSEDIDLDILTAEAEEEWEEIRNAFTILEDNFGREFQALGAEYCTPVQTPFGTSLHYRTYGIAGIWMNYYMGLIVCHRSHPSMPPAAMMAAGIAARQTAAFASEIGRIAAGIAPGCDSTTTHITPNVGAAVIESCMPLFVAGVQFQDVGQRAWTVERLRAISRLTGWQTADAILQGCETSWIRVGEMGRGPPYTRTGQRETQPSWAQSRRIDRALAASDGGVGDRRLVVAKIDRAHYALGILTFQDDFSRLDLGDDDEKSAD